VCFLLVVVSAFRCNFDNAKSCFFRAFNALSLIRAKYCYMRLWCVPYTRFTLTLKTFRLNLFMKLFRTASPAVVKCCQLAFNFLPVHSQLDILFCVDVPLNINHSIDRAVIAVIDI